MEKTVNYKQDQILQEGYEMDDQYGSDFMTIVDEDGTEFELEILS